MYQLDTFPSDEAGGIHIDWVALTAGVVLLGALVLHEVYYAGIAPGVLGAGAASGDDVAQLSRVGGSGCNTVNRC